MSEKKKISIVIPVYNSKCTVVRCLDSIKSQTYQEYEVIIIDDKSKDNTVKIIEEEINNDDRFKIYTLPSNEGVAYARNYGIEKSRGEYVTFIDADDVIHPKYLEILLREATKNNDPLVTLGRVVDFYNDNKKNIPVDWEINDNLKSEYYTLDSLFDYNTSAGITSWGSLYRADIIKDIRFDSSLSVGEDTLFWAQSFVKAGGVRRVNIPLYCYVHYSESLLHGELNEKRYSEVVAWEKVGKFYENNVPNEFIGRFRSSYYLAYVIRLKRKYFEDSSGNYKKKLYLKVRNSFRYVIFGDVALKSKVSMLLFLINPKIYYKYKKLM